MRKSLLSCLFVIFAVQVFGQAYSLPNTDTGCPSNCRMITWQTGSDLWNGGVLPSYTSVTCTGLAGNGTTNDGPAIQSCITALSTNQCAFIPAGTYLVNSTVRLKSSICLRGAKAEGGPPFLPATDSGATTLKLGTSALLTTQNFSPSSGSLDPAVTFATSSPGYTITNAPVKGDTTFTKGTGTLSVGQWISLQWDNDPSLVSSTGEDGLCQWCGENTGFRVQQQIVQVTGVSGSTITINRPFYYTAFTNPMYRKYTFGTQKAGFENLRIDGSTVDMTSQLILLQGCLYCWVANVETFGAGDHSGAVHIELNYTYGNEIRDSAIHGQTGTTGSSNVNNNTAGASGSAYGVYFQFSNSDAKVENNIFQHNRHWIVYQGGGSGTAILYNYADNGYTDDLSYLASGRTSHGAHPFMNLFEGNVTSHLTADNFWGTSSHFVFFRNWLWGGETNTTSPGCTGTPTQPLPQCSVPLFPPTNGFNALDIYDGQPYYAAVGNVLGSTSTYVTLAAQPTWASATLSGFNEQPSATSPMVYSVGGTPTYSGHVTTGSSATIIRHGNYDFKTNGVAFWDGGSNHTLATSMYYGSKPAFFGGCTWPSIGPDITPVATTSMPAFNRFSGNTCSAAAVTGSGVKTGTRMTAGTIVQ